MTHVNPPPQLKLPKQFLDDKEIRAYFERQNQILYQLWLRTGGGSDAISNLENEELFETGMVDARVTELSESIAELIEQTNPNISGYVNELEQRISALEIEKIQPNVTELENRIDELESEITALYGARPADYGEFVKRLGDEMLGQLTLVAGTTSVAPLLLQAGSFLTTPVDGALEYAGGHWTITNGARHVICSNEGVVQSTTTVSNTVTETTVFSYTFAAGELHADQRVVFLISGAYSNASASDDFTINFKLAGSTIATVSRAGGNVTDAGWFARFEITVRTEGASGTYVHWAAFNDGTTDYAIADITEHSIDTTGTNLFEVTVTWDNAKAGNTFSSTQGELTFIH